MTNNKVVLGFTGLMASGKGTAAKYLEEKYGAANLRFSTILRDVADRLYVPQSRDNLIKMSEVLRGNFGEDLLAKVMAGDAAKNSQSIIIVEGIRRPADIIHLSAMPHFVLVEIFAEPQTRYKRLVAREENTDDTTKTYEQFLADHQRSTELSILEVIPLAKEKIDNNGTLEDLHRQLDNLIKKYVG